MARVRRRPQQHHPHAATLTAAVRASLLGEDALRQGVFFGAFGFLWKATVSVMTALRGGGDRDGENSGGPRRLDRVTGFVAGLVAGLAILAEKREQRVTIAQQVLVRGLQAVFNSLKTGGHFHFAHGDSVIFALSTAQIMYSYAMQPSTIPRAYYKFVQTTGPITEQALVLARSSVYRGEGVSPAAVMDAITTNPMGSPTAKALAFGRALDPLGTAAAVTIDMLPCEVLHPHVDSCNVQAAGVWLDVFQKIAPVYISLNLIPVVAFRLRRLLHDPATVMKRVLYNTATSATFLSVFVSVYMRLVCLIRDLHRRGVIHKDHKYLYWLVGLLSSSAILIEDKKRRSELAMYLVPRGLTSLHNLLALRRATVDVPYFEVAMFSAGMGLVVMYLHADRDMLGGFIRAVMVEIDRWIEDPPPQSLQRRRRGSVVSGGGGGVAAAEDGRARAH
ncbi:hypothetical protein HK405_010064 [Cladochytrium tenue]|nr:hypothetical protein HK405_010064 [Cladochytrium tenue]